MKETKGNQTEKVTRQDVGLEKDYYFENGLLVMTEKHHMNRGYCCGYRCRHCPYEYVNVTVKKG